MQILVTHGRVPRTRAFQFSRWQLAAIAAAIVFVLVLLSGAVYHYLFLKAAQEGWPVVSQIVKLVVRDEIAQRDRFMRENLDMLAQRVGEMQARLVRLDAVGERVSGLAGVKPADLTPLQRPASAAGGGQGGPRVWTDAATVGSLQQAIARLEESADRSSDIFTLVESRLFEARLQALMVPSSAPVDGGVGSGFGFRADPFTGRAALHTGLDYPGDVGTPIHAAAGGVVVAAETHPAYGHVLELDHGNGLVTRYAHTSRFLVRVGDLVKRGQAIAHIGNSGRSTGPHLHFEVLVEGVPQDPARFLAGAGQRTAMTGPRR